MRRWFSVSFSVLVVLCILTQGSVAEEFTHFAGYCAAVGTVDDPANDLRYTGEPLPQAVIEGLIAHNVMSENTPPEILNNAVWRCMEGELWACHFGANLPCLDKADTQETPSEAMTTFCQEQPDADTIPMFVTGRTTVYAWRCAAGRPNIVKQVFTPDAQGFLSEFWYNLSAAPQITGIYSDIVYIEEEGDYVGVEVFILLSTEDGKPHYFALVQFAEGEPEPPQLVNVSVDGVRVEFNAMYFDRQVRFVGTVTWDGLQGDFIDLNQNVLLPKKSSIWQ